MPLAYRHQSELDFLLVLIRATDSHFSLAGHGRRSTPLLSLILTSLYTTIKDSNVLSLLQCKESHSPCDKEWQLDLHGAGYLV